MTYVLYNPLSNNKRGEAAKVTLEENYKGKKITFIDITTIQDYKDFFKKVRKADEIIIAGGDGTLNRFVNDTYDMKRKCSVYLFPNGSGNDFIHDLQGNTEFKNGLISLDGLIENLPEVRVNGITKRFLNGIGFGIDGYCCEVGDEFRAKSDEEVNYTAIAIKGLLGKFHPSNAKVTIDGVTREYKHVWLAPTMLGKYYGGGMEVAPAQDRRNLEKTLTVVVWHNWSKLGTLIAFPSIFKGEHIKHKKMVETFTGHEVTVEFDRPQALQIDGETVKNVTSYSVSYS